MSQFSEMETTGPFTSHPREVAQSTLQTISTYLEFIETMSKKSGELIEENEALPAFHASFTKLVDGMSTFTDAILQVKKAFKIGILQPVDILEADLLSILKDMLDYKQSGQLFYIKELLLVHLPKNLEQWRTDGIPTLIRARDS